MPVRSDMREMRRYGSVNSLSLTQDLRLSVASGDSLYSDDRQDGMYRSSPDLSMVSLAHTRSSSTDSTDGSYWNHSRQSSGSTDCSTRLSTGGLRRPSTTTTSTADPLQFVKTKSAEYLALQAKKQMQIAQEGNKMRYSVDSGSVSTSNEPDWQSNFNVWRERRKSASLVSDLKYFGQEELEEKKLNKTFSQILSATDKRRNLVRLYPTEDEDSSPGGSVKSGDTSLIKSQSKNTDTAPPLKSWKTTIEATSWARDSSGDDYSQSDSETNHSHQSGDTDSVFSDKSIHSKILSDDDSWVKNNPTVATLNNSSSLAQTGISLRANVKLWEDNVNESHKKDKTGKKMDISQDRSKITNIKQAFEQKDKVAHEQQTVQRRQEGRLKSDSSLLRRSQDFSEGSSPRFSTPNNKELVSPTGPKALLPKEQRYSQSSPLSQPMKNSNRKFTDKQIKIIQKPNNSKGFGFILIGGAEKKQPVTVQRVALGSAADVSGVQANDEVLAVKARDVSTLTLAQVQGIVEHSIKQGTIELTVRRYANDVVENIDGFSSAQSLTSNGDGKNRNQSKSNNNFNTTLKPEIQISSKADGTDKLKLMNQLIGEKERETEKPNTAQSPVINEQIIAEVTFNSRALPSKKMPDKPQVDTALQQQLSNNLDLSAPAEVTMTEERPKLSLKRSTAIEKEQPEPVQLRYNGTPTTLDTSPLPIPSKAEPPSLAQSPDSSSASEDSSCGPPAALLRWQRPRPKSEYHNTSTEQIGKSNRNSVTMPLPSENTLSFEKDNGGSGTLDKMSKDFATEVSVSDMAENKSKTFQFNDTTYIEEWQKKQDQQRMQEISSSQPVSIHREEKLTPQPASSLQTEVSYLQENNVPSYSAMPELSPQEKFERDQKLIRQQYEEEKKRAQEAEKQKQDKEKQVLNSDKFMHVMESQIIQTKQEAVDHNLVSFKPNVTAGAEPRYNSEPMTIQFSSADPGRPLIFDAKSQREAVPRNQGDVTDSVLKEVSFHVDHSKFQSAPPLRILSQQPELSQEELLAREREKIKQEVKQKFEEEQRKWKEEQELKLKQEQEKIRRERAQLQMDQERVQQERALLEQKKSNDYQSNNLLGPRSAGSTNSSLSPRSPPPTFVPKYQEKKTPPSTAPKPSKPRLTREDLLAMNRKPTPLTNRPENLEDINSHEMLSPTVREPPSKGELHSLNAVPKQKFRNSAAWIKEEDMQNAQYEKPFVIGKRSDVTHADNANDHWLVQEAERRRLADKTENENDRNENVNSITAHAGPTKPSQSALVSRFRGDIEPLSHSHRYSLPSYNIEDSHISSKTTRPLSASSSSLRKFEQNTDSGVTQFNARTRPSNYVGNTTMSQTLPPNLSFSANSKNFDISLKRPRSLKEDQEPVIAVSGKQKCSHCAEELGFGAAMVIDSLGLYYHVQCFRCCVCHTTLGNGSEGTDVRVRVNKLHCKNCYSNDEAGLKFSKV